MTNEVKLWHDAEVEMSFRVKKDESTGSETKRPSITLKYPVPTVAGIIDVLSGDPESKVVSMLKETVDGIIYTYLRTNYVDSDLEFSQEKLDALIAEGKVSLDYIANLPRADRSVVSKEDLEAFAKDYVSIMPEITNKPLAKVQAAAVLFVERLKRVAGDNDILRILLQQLQVFVEKAPEAMQKKHEDTLTYLVKKLQELLSVKVTADSL